MKPIPELILALSLISFGTPLAVLVVDWVPFSSHIYSNTPFVVGVLGGGVLSGYFIRRNARLALAIVGGMSVAAIVFLLSLFALLYFLGE